MAEHIKRMVAVAFLVASVPVLLLPGKLKNSLASEPETLTNLEADKLSKELLVLGQMMSNFEQEHVIHGTISGASSGKSRRLSLENPKQRGSSEQHGGTENAEPRRLSAASTTLQRRAVYTRWGSKTCPMGSKLIYSGFMSTSLYSHTGSGYNMLCMHPSPQMPSGYDAANNDGALLYGVEYENTGAIDRHHDYDAACAVCQWGAGGSVYVEWGNAESRDNPSTPKTCGNPAHEMIYTGLIMSEKYDHQKGEFICVDLERAYAGEADESDDNLNGGLLYTTEMEQGSADEYAYPHDREVGCTVCGVPAKSVNADGAITVTPASETAVFTVWGKKQCPPSAQLVYEGFMAGGHHNHGGSGANYICLTTSNPNPPSGYSDGNQNGALLYGTEYQNTGAIDHNHDGDAACAVCRYLSEARDVYVQWGRSSSCSNSHPTLYQGYVMGNHFTQHRSAHVCVHTDRETHPQSSWADNNGALLYTTEFQNFGGNHDHEVGCSSCGGSVGKSVFTRWGSRSCPTGSSSLLYEGTMMAEHYTHRGGGANTVCVHPQIQAPSGSSTGNQNGNLLYTMEYQNTGAIDANHDHEAACAVCELDHWESVYTQWGRSTTCTNGHITLYTGFVLAERYNHNKGEFLCVDSGREVIPGSNSGNQNGGLLYTTEMEQGSSDEEKYPHNVEVGCAVCAAEAEVQEVPFVRDTFVGPDGETYLRNAIHGEWVKIASVTAGQDVTVSYGYSASSGTSASEGETQQSARSRAVDFSSCTSSSYAATISETLSLEVEVKGPFGNGGAAGASITSAYTSSLGLSSCSGETNTDSTSVARAVTQGTSWGQSYTETRSFSLSIPSQIPAGVAEADSISALGVDVWQWRWTVVEGAHEGVSAKMYHAKAQSRFVFAPVSSGGGPARPRRRRARALGTSGRTAMGVPPGTVPLALLAAMEKAGDPRSGPCLRDFGHVFPVPFVGHSGLLVPSEGPLPEEVREQASICECRDLAPGAEYLLVRVRLREYLRRHEAAGRWTVVGENATARAASSFGMCLPAGCAGEDGSAPSAALRAVVLWFVFLAGAGLPVDVADAPPLRPGDVSTRRCCRPRDAGGDSLAHHFGGGRGAARDDYVVVGAGAFCPRLGPRPAVPGGRAPRVFATYVSPRRQMYRDGAVLLGLALQRHAPEVPRLALVEDLGSARGYGATLRSLEAAGWHVWPVAARQPPLAPETSLVGSYAKIEVWRVDADEVVYLDSDSWVRSPLVLEMFDALRDSPVAMVRNCYWDTREQQYNGGVIALRPDLQKFATLDSYLMPGIHNDQWAINGVYERGEIRELPARFNVHCSLVQEGLTSAEEAVVVHFTGLVQSADGSATGKPALAHPGVLRQVRHGRGLLYGAIHGGAALYSEYFEEMLAVAPSGLLSAELRAALQEAVAVG